MLHLIITVIALIHLFQMFVRIEPGGHRVLKFGEELFLWVVAKAVS